MSPLITWIGAIAGGGGVLTVFAVAILWLTRSAIAKAIEQAGVREIERLKSQLQGELDAKRNAFARELEADRHAGAKALASFNTELMLEAEVRRQVAAKKVAALLRVSETTTKLIRAFHDDGHGSEGRFDEHVAWAHDLADIEILLSNATRIAMFEFERAVAVANQQMTQRELRAGPAVEKLQAQEGLVKARQELLRALRLELQVEEGNVLSKSTSESGAR